MSDPRPPPVQFVMDVRPARVASVAAVAYRIALSGKLRLEVGEQIERADGTYVLAVPLLFSSPGKMGEQIKKVYVCEDVSLAALAVEDAESAKHIIEVVAESVPFAGVRPVDRPGAGGSASHMAIPLHMAVFRGKDGAPLGHRYVPGAVYVVALCWRPRERSGLVEVGSDAEGFVYREPHYIAQPAAAPFENPAWKAKRILRNQFFCFAAWLPSLFVPRVSK